MTTQTAPTKPTATAIRLIQPSAFRLSGFSPRALAGALTALALLLAAPLSLAPLLHADPITIGPDANKDITTFADIGANLSEVTFDTSGTLTIKNNVTIDGLSGPDQRLSIATTANVSIIPDPLADPSPTLIWKNNTASTFGGAIGISAGATLNLTNVTFLGNKATGNGGAIGLSAGATLNLTNVSFLDNTSTGIGGAIGFNSTTGNPMSTINLIVSAGSTARFAGNTEASGVSNSIKINVSGLTGNSTHTLKVDVGEGGLLDMLDPFSIYATGNAGANAPVTKVGLGTWKLAGSSTIAKQGGNTGLAASLEILAGKLYLYGANEPAVFDPISGKSYTPTPGKITQTNAGGTANNAQTRFLLKAGATLGIGGGNSISLLQGNNAATTITLEKNSTLEFNLNYMSPNNPTPMLTLNLGPMLAGSASIFTPGGALNPLLAFDFDPATLENGTYNLLTIAGTNYGTYLATTLTDFTTLRDTATYAGLNYTDFLAASGLNSVQFGVTSNTLWAKFVGAVYAGQILTWTGVNGTDLAATGNWNDPAATPATFATGDILNLAALPAAAPATINLLATATTAAIYVNGASSYTITGASLTTDTAYAAYEGLYIPSGKLILGQNPVDLSHTAPLAFTGTLDLTQQTGANDFKGGVDINSGIIRIATPAQLGAPLSKVNFLSAPADTSPATLQIATGKNVTFDSASGTTNRLTLAGAKTATFILEDNATLTFSSNTTTANGGAITLGIGSSLILAPAPAGSQYIFRDNYSGNQGGAIYGAGAATYIEVNNALFVSNTATSNGGAIYNVTAGSRTKVANSEFRNNYSGANGGAISVSNAGNVLDLNGALFINNIANNGGAMIIATSGTATITNALFVSNTCNVVGGAIFNNGNNSVITINDSSFYDNKAGTLGGAYGFNGSQNAFFTLNATTGTSRFAGNTANSNTTPTPNSIDFGYGGINAAISGTANFNVSSTALLDMLDPMTGLIGNNTNTVSVNLTINKTGPGAWNLAGPSTITKNGDPATALGSLSLNINEGTLHLYRAGTIHVTNATAGIDKDYTIDTASITLAGNNPAQAALTSFTLAAPATLSAAGGNTITAGKITLADNSTLALDLAGAQLLTDLAPTASLLTLNAPTLTADWTKINLNLLGTLDTTGLTDSGTYNLITLLGATTPFIAPDLTGFLTLTNPNAYTLQLNDTKNILQLLYTALATPNSVLNWTGATTSLSAPTGNWTLALDNTDAKLRKGDIINLALTAAPLATTLDIDTTTSNTLAAIYVSGNQNYTITGSPLVTAADIPNGTFTGSAAATGKLVLGGSAAPTGDTYVTSVTQPAVTYTGTLTFANGANTFTGGVDILSGALQLGNGTTATLVTGNILNNAALILNNGANSVVMTNTITGNGLITKAATDTGILVLTADSGAFTGTTQIKAGTLSLSNAAKLGGDLKLSASTALMGNGAIGGNVDATPGNVSIIVHDAISTALGAASGTTSLGAGGSTTINIGSGGLGGGGLVLGGGGGLTLAGAPEESAPIAAAAAAATNTTLETLTIGGTLTLGAGSIISYNLAGTDQADLLKVGALALIGTSTINISSANSGAYTLITSTAALATTDTANLLTTLNNAALSGRSSALYSLANSDHDLLLTINSYNIALAWSGAPNGTWDTTSANWTNATSLDNKFNTGDRVTFTDATTTAYTITIAAPVTAADMTVDTAGPITFTGSPITTDAASATNPHATFGAAATGKLTKTGAGTLDLTQQTGVNTFTAGIDILNGAIIGSADNLRTTGTLNLAAATSTVNFAQAAAANYTSPITGPGTLVKTLAGNLTLSGTTNYTGATNINAGTLTLANANQIANSTTVALAAGATLDLPGAAAQQLNHLTGSGNITTGNNALTLANTAATSTYSGIISGAATIQKTGASTLILAGNNTTTGALTITAGALQLGSGAAAGSIAGPITIAAPATLILNHGANPTTLANAISGAGLITKAATDTGTLTLTGAAATFTGTTEILKGGLILASNTLGALASQLHLADATTLTYTGPAAIGGNLKADGHNTITVGTAPTQTLTIGGTLTLGANSTLNYYIVEPTAASLLKVGALDYAGTGTINLAPDITKSGTYTLIQSTAALATAATAFKTTLNGYALNDRVTGTYTLSPDTKNLILTLDMLNASIIWAGTNSGTWAVGRANWQNGNAFLNGDTVNFTDAALPAARAVTIDTAGVAPAAMTVTTTGTYTFTGGPITSGTLLINGGLTDLQNAANTFTNGITIQSGTLRGSAAALAVGPTATLANASALIFNQAADATYTSTITGAGTITKQGAAKLTLSDATYAGGLNLQQGALTLQKADTTTQGPINLAASTTLTLTPGATYTFQNALTGTGGLINLGPTGAVTITTAAGTTYAGTLSLGASALTLDTTAAAALKNATLALNTSNTTTITPGTQQIGNLAINGAKLDFTSGGQIATGTLNLGTAPTTVQVSVPLAPALLGTGTSLFAQASGTTLAKLVTATAVTGNTALTGYTLLDQTGANLATASSTAAINGPAATGTYTYKLDPTAGLNVNYGLTGLTINPGQTLTLAPAAGENTFNATIGGPGTLDIAATAPGATTVTLAKDNTAFTGATTLTAGTLVAAANNALGATGTLTQSPNTTYNLGANTQTLGALTTTAATATTTIAPAGKLTITNATNYAGTLANAGLTTLTGPATLGTVNNTGTLNANNTALITGPLTNNGLATITGSSALAAVTNTGTLNLAAATIAGALNNTGPLAATAPVTFNAAVTSSAPITLAAGGAFNSTLANNATLTNNAGNLAIAGALTGNGPLAINGGNTTIAQANPDYKGAATTAPTGTLTLNNLQSLAAAPITNNGVLNINNTAPGTLANPITGPGALNLNGPATIAQANAITGPVTVNAAITGSDLAALGSGSITITTAGALAYTPAAGGALTNPITDNGALTLAPATGVLTVPNAIAGAGALTLSGTTDLAGSNAALTAVTILDNAAVTASNPAALGSPSAAVAIGNAATVTLAAPNATLGNVTMSPASALGYAKGMTPGTLKLASLAAAPGATPTLALNTNLAEEKVDYLDIAGALTGNFNLDLSNTGAEPTNIGTTAVPLNFIAAGKAAAGQITGSGTISAPAGEHWTHSYNWIIDETGSPVLNLSQGKISIDSAGIIANATGAMPLTWFAELDALSKRLGDLHLENRRTHGTDLWLRGHTQRINVNDKDTCVPFNETQYGTEVGADYGGPTGYGSTLYAGGFLGYGSSSRKVDGTPDTANTGPTSDTTSYSAGAYLTIVYPGGWYVDIVGKYNYFKNKFSFSSPDAAMNARYHTNAFGASVEAGRRIELANNWYVTPSAQAALVRIAGTDYTTESASDGLRLPVAQERVASQHLRAGAQLGYTHVTKSGRILQPYAKLHVANQWTSGGRLAIQAGQAELYDPAIKGARLETGVGLNWQAMKALQVYIDYEAAFARDYTKPYGLTLGASYAW